MKKFLTIIAFSLGSISAFSQQDPQFTQFMYNKLFINPGYAGMKHALCFTGIARQQWAGFDGSPKSGVFSADFFLPGMGRSGSGVGLDVMYDQLGFERNTSFRLDYSFHQTFRNGGVLGIGLECGVFSKRIGPTGNDHWLATTNWQTDPTVPLQLKKTAMDLGAGLWYEQRNIWFGISTTHINGKLLDGTDEQINMITHPVLYQMARHYFITGGVDLNVSPDWQIRPSFLVKSDATITSFDLNVLAVYDDLFWFGASYRFMDAICPMIGFQAKAVKVGFAYDYTTSNLKNYNNGTFELFLNYCIPVKWDPRTPKVNSERFFD